MFAEEIAGGRRVIRGTALCFTDEGQRLAASIPGVQVLRHGRDFQNTREVTEHLFGREDLLVFVAAAGIAVRSIAGCIRTKDRDPAVIVMDDAGRFVIPLLSGHLGGANRWSRHIAAITGGMPVITTASDNRRREAVDTRAERSGYHIPDLAAAKALTAAIVAGRSLDIQRGREQIRIREACGSAAGTLPADGSAEITAGALTLTEKDAAETADEERLVTELTLWAKEYVVGVGCRRGIGSAELEAFVRAQLAQVGIEDWQVYAVTSIDRKAEEPAIHDLARSLRSPFVVYTAGQLNALEGDFAASAFVAQTVGTDNVCERSAVAGCGGAFEKFALRKTAGDGMTAAVARRIADPDTF